MNHLNEEQLVLHYYGDDGAGRQAVAGHLQECGACRAQLAALRAVLDNVEGPAVPERGPAYGAEVWARLQPSLPARPSRRWYHLPRFPLPLWASAAAVAALVIVAFFAGRWQERNRHTSELAKDSSSRAERILAIAVGDHLERSQMVLAEMANADPEGGPLNISEERQWAQDLLGENRLYRQTAQRTGDTAMASVLDDLERVLMEIANAPETVSERELAALRGRIESEGILFKVRVVGSRLRKRQATFGSGQPAAGKQVL